MREGDDELSSSSSRPDESADSVTEGVVADSTAFCSAAVSVKEDDDRDVDSAMVVIIRDKCTRKTSDAAGQQIDFGFAKDQQQQEDRHSRIDCVREQPFDRKGFFEFVCVNATDEG